MGIREYDHEYSINYDVEKAQKSEQQISLEKNNDERDKLCKNICLIVGWSLVITLLMYIIMKEMC
tara:strand:- start:2192 stop:2386 length:195 start_codon:yes stop_codon:yes gene_type:complete